MVLGIGLNVEIAEDQFPPELRDTATSLLIAGGARPVSDLLGSLLNALDRWTAAAHDEVLGAWRERDALHGSRIAWEGGEGTAAGVDDSGALLGDTGSGRVALDAREVHLRRG